MNSIVDTIVVILFIIVLFIVIGGFNRQMVEKNKERARIAKEREEKPNKAKEQKEND